MSNLAREMTSPEWRVGLRRAAFHGLVAAGLVFALYLFVVAAQVKGSMAFDVVSYWRVDFADLYRGNVGDLGFFPYSPAVALAFAPFTLLPWQVFVALWYAVLIAALTWLGRREVLVLLAFPPVAIELYHGNIHLLIAAAIVAGFRWPAAWSFLLLSKVTPGIALLWFVARREWRNLAICLATTGAIVAVTAVLLPSQWASWISMLSASSGTQPPWPALPIPLWPRLAAAAAIIWWGARRDARWAVPVGAAIAVPALWPGAFAILAACWPLRSAARRAAASRVRARGAGTEGAGAQSKLTPAPVSPDYHAPDAPDPHRETRRERAPVSA